MIDKAAKYKLQRDVLLEAVMRIAGECIGTGGHPDVSGIERVAIEALYKINDKDAEDELKKRMLAGFPRLVSSCGFSS